ncbi:Uncharacterized membrane protein [Roseateles sp. YR242]|uniref:DUF2177 family protein n=1 Tax=Roseateles sp. YR242 TaxID=1855305 RepID=UPI0008B280A7|nr:DUF2177 family protein [Roseateles sp. YR242]SEK58255.1 Uncharacterized membrane protein [Roseateles sp. YR242]
MTLRPDPHAWHHAPVWRWPLAYVLIALVFLAMDAVWLGSLSASLYQPAIGHLMAPSVDWAAAVAFYLLYVGGLLFFAVAPALSRPQAQAAFALGRGAVFGLLAYATYDLTNQATLRDWPWHVTLLDLAWGTIASGVACGIGTALTAATCRRVRPANGP